MEDLLLNLIHIYLYEFSFLLFLYMAILLIKLYRHLFRWCGKLNLTHNRKHIWSLWNDLTHVWPNKDNMDRTGLNRDDIGFRLEILLNIYRTRQECYQIHWPNVKRNIKKWSLIIRAIQWKLYLTQLCNLQTKLTRLIIIINLINMTRNIW